MKYVIVTIQWAVAHGIMPLPYQRKSNDGSKIILHDEMVLPVIRRESQDPSDVILGEYDHNSVLDFLDTDPEWSGGGADETAASPGYVQAAAAKTLMSVTRAGIQDLKMSDKEKLAVSDVYPEWTAGIEVTSGECYRCDGSLWEVRTSHTTQSNWRPSAATLSIWRKVDAEAHAGTADDPIPFEQGMDIEVGKYYSQYGVTYKAIQSATAAVWDLKDIPAIVTPV